MRHHPHARPGQEITIDALATLPRRLASAVTGTGPGYVPTLRFLPFEPTGEGCIACMADLESNHVASIPYEDDGGFKLCPSCLCLSDEKLCVLLAAKAAEYQCDLESAIREGDDSSLWEWLALNMAKLAAHGFLVDPEGIQAWLGTIPVCCHPAVRAQVEAAVMGAAT